jgi:hypothetical protein
MKRLLPNHNIANPSPPKAALLCYYHTVLPKAALLCQYHTVLVFYLHITSHIVSEDPYTLNNPKIL